MRTRLAANRDRWGAAFAILCVLAVTLWALHPTLLVAQTLTAGGDTGAHVALPWFIRTELLPHGHLTGWYPGWFDGFPLYTYYFVLSDLIAAVASYVIPYTIAFKLTTVLGSLLLPCCAYAMGRLFKLRAPLPACIAAATLPFLFEASFTILGGNLFSTLAGEYAFSLSLALAVVAVGLFARGLRTGRGVVAAAVALALTLAAHMVPWLWAIGGCMVLVAIDLVPASWGLSDPMPADRRRPPRATISFAARTGVLTAALSAWWLLPWVTSQGYAISMGYVNDGSPGEPTFASQLFPGGDHIMLVVALIAVVVAWAQRSRFAVWLTTVTVATAIAYMADPQGSLWDERILPFWFFGAWLTCGWLFGTTAAAVARRVRRTAAERWIASVHTERRQRGPRPVIEAGWPAAFAGAAAAGLVAMLIVLPPMSSLVPASWLHSVGITPGANEVPNWSAYNYTGYQGVKGWAYQKNWPEYHAVIEMMSHLGVTNGCGQAMWEYEPSLTTFGTTESLMLLPYWTNNCIGSMEGLLFESSATTPYHFLDQSEVSVSPSDPMAGLPYGPSGSPNVDLGIEHLQILGVRYFMCFTPSIVAAAKRDPLLEEVATTGPYTYEGVTTSWDAFELKSSPLVSSLPNLPNVDPSLSSGSAWLAANATWWVTPGDLDVPLAASGPPSWPRVTTPARARTVAASSTVVTDVAETVSSISFHVSRVGTPVLVHVSYYPRWHATGAEGPWRVSPNLMVVVPTSHRVELAYGGSTATTLGTAATLAGVAISVAAVGAGAVVRRRRRSLR